MEKSNMVNLWDTEWFAEVKNGQRYCVLKNHDGKHWFLPEMDLKLGLELYQPTTLKGKLIKFFYPVVHKIPIMDKLLKINVVTLKFSALAIRVGQELFGTDQLPAFYFLDSAIEANHKLTAQYICGKKILGYVKFTDSHNVADTFKKEEQVLINLKKCGMTHVPECLGVGEEHGIFFFAQSTLKTTASKRNYDFSSEQVQFLTELFNKTRIESKFKFSYEYGLLKELEEYLKQDSVHDCDLLLQIISDTLSKANMAVTCLCCGHNDFTPWNIYWFNNELQVFDFEYAEMNCVPYLDAFHYWLQPLILDKRWNATEIINKLSDLAILPISKELKLEEWFSLYFLKIIAFHYRRNNGKFEWNDKCYLVWRDLLIQLT